MEWGLLIVVLILVPLFVGRIGENLAFARRFRGRRDLPIIDQLAAVGVRDESSVSRACQLADEIARLIGIAPSRLRLADRFDVELRPVYGMSFDNHLGPITDLVRNISPDIMITEDRLKKIRTLGDCLMLCVSPLDQRQQE
jgi:hypothetical protein